MDNQPNQPINIPPQPPAFQPPSLPQSFPAQAAPAPAPSPTGYPLPSGVDPGKTYAIVGFIFAFIFLDLIGLVLSIIGHHKSNQAGFKNGLAVAGIWLNTIGLILSLPVILLMITLSTFSGVDQRANTTQAQINAVSTQKVAETYNANQLRYPDTRNELLGDSAAITLPAGISLLNEGNEALSNNNGLETIWYQYDGPAGAATGGRIQYWDFTTDKIADTIIYLGDGTANSTFSNLK